MKHLVSDLTGALLDAAVAKAEGLDPEIINLDGVPTSVECDGWQVFTPSTDWTQGGPIIERDRITLCPPGFMLSGQWEAFIEARLTRRNSEMDVTGKFSGWGETPLAAAMRAYVASKFGPEVDL